MNKLLHILFVLFISLSAPAMEIKGTIQLQDDWQPIVFLASLNSPDNLFVASPDFVIAETFIQPDGSFSIQTNSLHEDSRFYRIYLMKGNNSSVEFNTSNQRNYQHLLLHQHSQIQIDAKVENNTLIINSLLGSEDNNAILNFDAEIAQRNLQFTSSITKAKSNFLTTDLEKYIRDFVESAPNALVGLYALYHLDEKDTDFLRNSEFYFNFEKRIEQQYPNSYYAEEYSELLKSLVGFRELVCEIPGVQPKWKDQVIIAEAILILLLLLLVLWLLITQKKNVRSRIETEAHVNLYAGLTTKQQEILRLLAEGKTNKEIALELFVELSTVKTHINNIYRQLGVSSRKEAADYFNAVHES